MQQEGEIRRAVARNSRIHGTGLFATEDIAPDEKIVEYTGERITKAEGNRRYDEQAKVGRIYLFELNSRYDLDGAVNGNIAKYGNHSCDPNAEAVIEKGHIWLIALKPIQKGEEITFDYNFPLFDYEKRPCRCGTEKCRGWIINKDSYYYLRRKERLAQSRNGAGTHKAPAARQPAQARKKAGKKAGKSARKGPRSA
jgi:uncharacterized protein